MLNIKVITGSTREGRFSEKAANWVAGVLENNENIKAEVVDLCDYDMPFFNEATLPAAKTEPYKNEEVARFTAKIAEGDAFVIIAPEYNHGYPAVLKNALDWVFGEWSNKPVAFVGYGSVGGARSIEQLRLVAINLEMAPVNAAVNIAAEDYFPVLFGGASEAELFAKYDDKVNDIAEKLVLWGTALKTVR